MVLEDPGSRRRRRGRWRSDSSRQRKRAGGTTRGRYFAGEPGATASAAQVYGTSSKSKVVTAARRWHRSGGASAGRPSRRNTIRSPSVPPWSSQAFCGEPVPRWRTCGILRGLRHQRIDKHKKHGLLFLALTDQAGNLIWISSARRGAASEITAARHDHLDRPAVRRRARRPRRPRLHRPGPRPRRPRHHHRLEIHPARKTTPAQRHANQALSAARAPVEHGFSDLKNWRIITRLRLDPAKATMLLRALLVLTRQHTTR